MSERKILATNRSIQVEACTEPDEELLTHIKSAILGTPGRMRYKLTRIENKLAHMKEIYFFLLRVRGHLLGSVGFNKRITYTGGKANRSWYIRYFYINAPLRSKSQEKEKLRDPGKGKNTIREAALPYMKEPAKLIPEKYDPDEKNLVYGYIESMNFRSLNFSEQSDAVTIRKFQTLIFSRISIPKMNGKVRRLKKKETDSYKITLKEFYSEYSFYTDENMFFDGNYFVYAEGDEILAGLQVHPETWKILEVPGMSNRLMFKVLPSLPVIRNIFNPKDFRFLALEGFYYKKGYEHLFETLIESVCKHFKIHMALIWLDIDSDLMKIFRKTVNPGIIGRSFDPVEVDVRVTFNKYSEEEKQEFFERPAYISAYDSV